MPEKVPKIAQNRKIDSPKSEISEVESIKSLKIEPLDRGKFEKLK